MNWNNIDLSSAYERDQPILNDYTSSILLLEISTNVREINEQTIRAQFTESLNSKVQSAKEIFEANLQNYLTQATKDRNEK